MTALDSSIVIPQDVSHSFAAFILEQDVPPAYINNTSPPAADVPTPLARAQLRYVCNERRIKSTGALLVSVLAATFSMFTTAWNLLTLLMATAARRHPGGIPCSRFSIPVGVSIRSNYCHFQEISALRQIIVHIMNTRSTPELQDDPSMSPARRRVLFPKKTDLDSLMIYETE